MRASRPAVLNQGAANQFRLIYAYERRIVMNLVHIRSAQFPAVFVRLDGSGVTQYNPNGSGVVNAQYTAGAWETYKKIDNPDGSVSFESNAFPNTFLRLDGQGVTQYQPNGAGKVNAQFTAGAWERFNIVTNPDGTQSIGSQTFQNVFLRLDGRDVTQFMPNGGGVVNAQYTHSSWESFLIHNCLTPERCNHAIDQFMQMFPQEANKIAANRQTIVNACCPAFGPAVDLSTLPEIPYALTADFATENQRDLSVSPCATAVVKAAFDCLSLLASLFGLIVTFTQTQFRSLYLAIGDVPSKLIVLLDAIKNTEGAQRALAIGKYIGGLWNVGAFKAWWGVITDSLSWWQWVVLGVTVVAQVIAWVATEWVAFAAEVVLVLASLPTLIADVINAVSVCGTNNAPAELVPA